MKKLLIFLFATVCISPLWAQDAMSVIQTKYADDSLMLKKIEQFKKGGYGWSFDCGEHVREELIETAEAYLGTPYQYGGTTSKGLDCSGLIFRTFTDLGLRAPHGAQALARYGQIILDKRELRPGDVIFFTNTYHTHKLVTHAAFVLDEGLMIHASTSKGVQIIPIDEPYYWNAHYLFAARLFE